MSDVASESGIPKAPDEEMSEARARAEFSLVWCGRQRASHFFFTEVLPRLGMSRSEYEEWTKKARGPRTVRCKGKEGGSIRAISTPCGGAAGHRLRR